MLALNTIHQQTRLPLRVNSRHRVTSALCPRCHEKRKSNRSRGISAKCQDRSRSGYSITIRIRNEKALAADAQRRPERGRYLLQVDRQTKNSYTTSEAAQSVALAIKTGYLIVQVSVYDSVEHTHTMVEVLAASS